MSASDPPPPSKIPGTSSNTGLYLAGIIILFLGAVGLFVWKSKSSTPTTTAKEAAVVATSTEPPAPPPPIYAPPPPPKLDDEPDAGLDAGKAVAKSSGSGAPAPGPCGGTCTGASTPDLQARLRGAAQSAQGCYNRALRTSEASGRLMVSVQVSATGSVCSASITNDEVHSPEISSCVLGKFRSSSFPPPSGGCLTVNIPIAFSIKQ